ncbi:MAG: hypothetical protein ACYDGR_12295 [Candidatus Dormibacteria bacterium]
MATEAPATVDFEFKLVWRGEFERAAARRVQGQHREPDARTLELADRKRD